MTVLDTVTFTNLGAMGTPYCERFLLAEHIKSGKGSYERIAPDLEKQIAHSSESYVEPVSIRFLRIEEEQHDPFPDMERLGKPLLFSQLHYVLSNPTPELRAKIPNDTYIGVPVSTDGVGFVWVKVNWDVGHSMGLFVLRPDWKWRSQSVFLVLERP